MTMLVYSVEAQVRCFQTADSVTTASWGSHADTKQNMKLEKMRKVPQILDTRNFQIECMSHIAAIRGEGL